MAGVDIHATGAHEGHDHVWVKIIDLTGRLGTIVFPLIIASGNHVCDYGWRRLLPNTMLVLMETREHAEALCLVYQTIILSEIIDHNPQHFWDDFRRSSVPPVVSSYLVRVILKIRPFTVSQAKTVSDHYGRRLLGYRHTKHDLGVDVYFSSILEAESLRETFMMGGWIAATYEIERIEETEDICVYLAEPPNLDAPSTTKGEQTLNMVREQTKAWLNTAEGRTVAILRKTVVTAMIDAQVLGAPRSSMVADFVGEDAAVCNPTLRKPRMWHPIQKAPLHSLICTARFLTDAVLIQGEPQPLSTRARLAAVHQAREILVSEVLSGLCHQTATSNPDSLSPSFILTLVDNDAAKFVENTTMTVYPVSDRGAFIFEFARTTVPEAIGPTDHKMKFPAGLAARARRRANASLKPEPWSSVVLNELPLPPQPRRDQLNLTIPGIIRDIKSWHSTNRLAPPSQEAIDAFVSSLPSSSSSGMFAIEETRFGRGNPLDVIAALSDGPDVGLHDPAIYVYYVRVRLDNALKALDIISKIDSPARKRIVESNRQIIAHLLQFCPRTYYCWLVYYGTTNNYLLRPWFDLQDNLLIKEPDTRSPLAVMLDVGANVASISDIGIVTRSGGVSTIHGDSTVINSPSILPSAIRIPLVNLNHLSASARAGIESAAIGAHGASQLNVQSGFETQWRFPAALVGIPEDPVSDTNLAKHVKFIGDVASLCSGENDTCKFFWSNYATLLHGSAVTIALLCPDTEGNDASFHVGVNTIICHPRVFSFNLFLVVMAPPSVSGTAQFSGISLAGRDYFTLYKIVLGGVTRCLMVIPHPGLHHYILYQSWTKDAMALCQALILLVANVFQEAEMRLIPVQNMVGYVENTATNEKVIMGIVNELQEFGSRHAWNPSTSNAIQFNLRLAPFKFRTSLQKSLDAHSTVCLTSFLPTTAAQPRHYEIITIPAHVGRWAHARIKLVALVPTVDTHMLLDATSARCPGQLTQIWLDARWKGPEPVKGHLVIDPSTLSLVFRRLDGTIHVDNQGEPFIVKRWNWMLAESLGSKDCMLQYHCSLYGWWREPNEMEKKESAGRRQDGKHSLRSDSRTVQTLLREDILTGVLNLVLPLIPLLHAPLDIRFWAASLLSFCPLHVNLPSQSWHLPWVNGEIKGATHFYPSYDFGLRQWQCLLFKWTEEHDWVPEFVGEHSTCFSSTLDSSSFLVKYGEITELFQGQQEEYNHSIPTSDPGEELLSDSAMQWEEDLQTGEPCQDTAMELREDDRVVVQTEEELWDMISV